MYKIGLIGFGGIASGYHYNTCQREDVPFELAGVYDLRESQRSLARERGVRTFDTLREFLDSRLFDFVVVAVSNNNHCPLACEALNAGYNVMVEKPAALSCKEIETMIDTAKKAGRIFTVHHNRRWDRDFLIVKQALEAGFMGKPYTIESRIHPRLAVGGGLPGWRSFPDHGGGMLLDWGIHMLDQLLYLIREPLVSVSANITSHRGKAVDDYSKLILTYESGLIAQLEVATFTPLWLPRWYICGEEGSLSMDFIGDTQAHIKRVAKSHFIDGEAAAYTMDAVEMRPVRGYCVDEIEEFDYPSKENLPPQDWASLYKNLAGVLDGKEELVVKPEEVLRCFRVIEAARVSAAEHRTILLN